MSLARSVFLLGGAAALGLCAPAPARAGIVVLKNGEVFVGRLRKEEVTDENITVRWPYKQEADPQGRGMMIIPRFRVRWYDLEGDVPSDAYWTEFENEKIDQRFLPLLERWRLRRNTGSEFVDIPPLLEPGGPRSKLSPIPVSGRDFELRKPDGWTTRTDGDITIIESNTVGAEDYRPQIHVYSVDALSASANSQLDWIKDELKKAVPDGFEVKEMKRPHPSNGGGIDQELVTASTRGPRTVYALRRVSFRKKRTYFFTAFAHQKDYDAYGVLFEQCMGTLQIREDQAAEAPGGAPPPGGASPPSVPGAPGEGAPAGGN